MPMKRIKIGERWVGDGESCFVIAEAGSNHNGDFEQAMRLIDAAVTAGADAVKFQHFKAAKLYPKSAGESDYLRQSKSIYEIIREMETPDDWIPRLATYCRERKIIFLSSPFDEMSADLLDPYVSAFKIASYEMTHVPLLRHIARKSKPMIVSTGTATLDEVLHAVKIITQEGNDQMILLQCTASYPTPLNAVNARALVTMREATGCLTGLSDHSRDPIVAPMTAVALGACMIEKHFTLSNDLPGPDHKFAVEPDELRALVERVRQVEHVLGHGRKETLPVETELRTFARRSIFTIRDIQPGEKLTRENIAVLRCGKLGFGLAPEHFEELLGRVAVRFIAKESLVTFEDIS
jgi:N-acetylneuraminate synthase